MLEGLDARSERMARLCVLRILWHGHRDAVDDVMQNAKMNAIRFADKFQQRCSYGTWFYRIAANQALMYRRGAESRLLRTGTDDELISVSETLPDRSPNPEELALANERSRVLREAIAELPEARRIAVLKMLDPERKEPLRGNDKINLHRAKLQLRELLKDSAVFQQSPA